VPDGLKKAEEGLGLKRKPASSWLNVPYLPRAQLKRLRAASWRLAPAHDFFCGADEAGATLMGGAPEGEVVGGDFLLCFGFFTSRLLRI